MSDSKRRRAETNGEDDSVASEDDYEVKPNTPPRNANHRRGRIDLSKMEAASLQRYRKVHKLNDVVPGSSKEELLPAVARHFHAQVVDEFETLSKLAATLKKQAEHGSIFAPAATKKPRAAAKR